MRTALPYFFGAIALTVAAAASAAPMVPNPAAPSDRNIVQAWAGCGWGFHPNRWGHCVPNHHAYYRPYRHYGYDGGYYHRWASPSDHMAAELNRRELYGY
jgi:hypothetical protein